MDELRTTPHDFIWRVKNPQDYWTDTLKEVKYDVYLNGKRRGGFIGVNRTFDDDMYYVNYYDENNNIAYCTAYTDTEIILKRVNRKEIDMEKIDNNIQLAFLGGMKAGLEALIHGLEVVAENNNGQVSFEFIKMVSASTIADVELKLSSIENGKGLIDALNNKSK